MCQIFYDYSFFITLEKFNLLAKENRCQASSDLQRIQSYNSLPLFSLSFLTKRVYCKAGCFDAAFLILKAF